MYQAPDQGDATVVHDEIKAYYDCRYISAWEAAWRIFCFDLHHRNPSVERLSFHLPNEQTIIFDDNDDLNEVVEKASTTTTKFLAWMEANRTYPFAKELLYSEFPNKFVYNARTKKWTPRKRGFSVGRLYYVPPSRSELYYMRMLLSQVKGVESFEDIRTINGVLYNSYREACYALGLLDDDKEYIDAIQESSLWGSADYLRRLFVLLLFSNSMSRPSFVWNTCWQYFSDDILYRRRRILRNNGIF